MLSAHKIDHKFINNTFFMIIFSGNKQPKENKRNISLKFLKLYKILRSKIIKLLNFTAFSSSFSIY